MPIDPDTGLFSRSFTFVDDRAKGQTITRSDLDAAFLDFEQVINDIVADDSSGMGLFLGTRTDAEDTDVSEDVDVISVVHPPIPSTTAAIHVYASSPECPALVTNGGTRYWRPQRVDDVRAWGCSQGDLVGDNNRVAANAALAYCGAAYFPRGIWRINGQLSGLDWRDDPTEFQPVHTYGDGPHVTTLRQMDLTATTILVKHRNLDWEASGDPSDYRRARMKPYIHDLTINYHTNAVVGAGGKAIHIHEAKDGKVENVVIDGPDYYIWLERAAQCTFETVTGQVTWRNEGNPAEAFFTFDHNPDLAALPKPRALNPGKSFGNHVYGCEFQGAAGVKTMFDLRSCDGLDIIGGHYNGHQTFMDLRGCDGTGGRTTIRQIKIGSGIYLDGDGDTRWIVRAGPWPLPEDWEDGDEKVIIDAITIDSSVTIRGRAGRELPTGLLKISAPAAGDLENLQQFSNFKVHGTELKAMMGVLVAAGAHESYSAADLAAKYTRWKFWSLEMTESFFGGPQKAKGTLVLSGAGTAGDTVTIGLRTYTLVSAFTAANQVLIGADAAATGANLAAAINAGSGSGTVYSTGTVAHADVTATGTSVVTVTAAVAGTAGNAIVTTETGAAMAFTAATLTGGRAAGDDDDDPLKPAFILQGSKHEILDCSLHGYRDQSDKNLILIGARCSQTVVGGNNFSIGTTKFLAQASGATDIFTYGNTNLDDAGDPDIGAASLDGFPLRARRFPSRAEAVAWVATHVPLDGMVLEFDGISVVRETGADLIPDMPGYVPRGEVRPEHCGAVYDGTTDDRAAIVAADAAAAELGRPLVFDAARVYAVQKIAGSPMIATTDWTGGGTIRAIGTATNVDLLRTGAEGLAFDVVLDNGAQLGSAFQIMHDRTETMPGFVAGWSAFQGLRALDKSNLKLRGRIVDTVNKAVLIKAATTDVFGLDIDMDVDLLELGTGAVNGGISIQGTETEDFADDPGPHNISFGVYAPAVKARVNMVEDDAYTTAGVCVEFRRGIFGGSVDAIASGGMLNFSINDCYGTVGTLTGLGARVTGLEFRGSENSSLHATIRPGLEGLGPNIPLTTHHNRNSLVRGTFHGVARDAYAACYSAGRADGVRVGGRFWMEGDLAAFARFNGSQKMVLDGARFGATGTVTSAIRASMALTTMGDSDGGLSPDAGGPGSCDDLTIRACDFGDTTNAFTLTGYDMGGGSEDKVFRRWRIADGTTLRNSSTDVVGDVTLEGWSVDQGSSLQTLPGALFPGSRPLVAQSAMFWDYQGVKGPSGFMAHITGGSPEGLVDAKVGSLVIDDTNARVYVKAAGADDDEGWQMLAQRGLVIDATDATATFTLTTGGPELRSTGTLTAARNWRLGATGAARGARWRVTRTGAGAFDLNILDNTSGVTLKALATGTWADFTFDGTNWVLSATGAL